MAARGKSENYFVEQLEKMVPLITEKMAPFIASERPVRQDVSEGASGVNKFDMDHWVKVDLSDHQSNATLQVQEKCSIVGLLTIDDHLDHWTKVLKHMKQGIVAVKFDVRGDELNLPRTRFTRHETFGFRSSFGMCLALYTQRFSLRPVTFRQRI